MAKNIVFCADGTWNGPKDETGAPVLDSDDSHGEISDAEVTNVVRLFSNLDGKTTPESAKLKNEIEKVLTTSDGTVQQVAKYLHGVGDSTNPMIKVLGGTLGFGVIERIVRGYTFVSRNYQPGDRIYLVGFSRGAYTARALGGMIAKVGLLNPASYDPSDKMEAYRLGFAAWSRAKGAQLKGTTKLTEAANAVLGFAQNIIGKELPEDGLIPDVPIKAIGVWDTVGAMGIPRYAADGRFDLLHFVDSALSEKVELGFHAMSIDERRQDFPVTKWDDRQGIEQVWFVGAHADVGGGYPVSESRLSDSALCWMTAKLTRSGVKFASVQAYAPAPDSVGVEIHEPWKKKPFAAFPQQARAPAITDTFHESFVRRWKADRAWTLPGCASLGQAQIEGLKIDRDGCT